MKFVTRDKILLAKYPGDIFSPDKATMRQEYLAYSKLYHPDVCHDSEIFKIISSLYQQGMKNLDYNGTLINEWSNRTIIIVDTNGKQYQMRYEGKYEFEFGMEFVGEYTILYIFEKQYEKYYRNMVQIIPKITYADDHMKQYFSNFMPKIRQHGTTTEGRFYIAIAKQDTEYPLKAMLNMSIFRQGLNSKDIAWMVSRLNNLICFLEFNGIVHNGITPDNLFVDLSKHGVCLYGGWWYAVKECTKMIGCTKQVYDVMPPGAKQSKVAMRVTDINCVKLFLKKNLDIHNDYKGELMQWACSPSTDDALKSLKEWSAKLDKAFGKREFHKMEVSKNEIYAG